MQSNHLSEIADMKPSSWTLVALEKTINNYFFLQLVNTAGLRCVSMIPLFDNSELVCVFFLNNQFDVVVSNCLGYRPGRDFSHLFSCGRLLSSFYKI